MPRQARPDGTDPPSPRNRRVHRTGDTVRRRSTSEVATTGQLPVVPDGQAAPTAPPATPLDGAAVAGGQTPATGATSRVTAPGETGSVGQGSLDAAAGLSGAVTGAHTGSVPADLGGARGGPAPVAESDWMAMARQQAEMASHRDSGLAAWMPGSGLDEDVEIDLTGSASLVRPYARTGGRTRPVRDLDMEALVRTTLAGKEASTSPWLNPEHTSIIEMSSGTVSVAEIAARLSVPLGVARVIIADMMDLGLVEVMKTSAAEGDERDPDFLRRVLSGLQRL
ncbi:MAG: DUF742 domain-containing protein [Kineosporiaceae bacterium]